MALFDCVTRISLSMGRLPFTRRGLQLTSIPDEILELKQLLGMDAVIELGGISQCLKKGSQMESRTVSRLEQPLPGNSWQPPPPGCVKINVHVGSINGAACLGAVCRSHSGAILFVATKSLVGKFSGQPTESLAI
ncbi:LOW QUALITY PROTEIN: hypothetical protein V2J09_022200 [Rumex salicifolius]